MPKFANSSELNAFQMGLGNTFTCNVPKYSVCVLLSAFISLRHCPEQTVRQSSVDFLWMNIIVIFKSGSDMKCRKILHHDFIVKGAAVLAQWIKVAQCAW